MLKRAGGACRIRDDHQFVCDVDLAPRPSWYERRTLTGKPMTRIGTLQGTYLGIYRANVCGFWTEKIEVNCKFCSVGLSLGVDDANEKTLYEVMEVVWTARARVGLHSFGLRPRM